MNPTEPELDEVPITDPNDHRLYNEDGVDLTLIHWMLSLTPAERLATHRSGIPVNGEKGMAILEPDAKAIVDVLQKHQVQFIVVGGKCGRLHGAAWMTDDLDIVHARTPENLAKLVPALLELHAYYREHKDRRLQPRAAFLEGPGHNLLATDAGPLDVLGAIGKDEGYNELIPHTVEIDVSARAPIRMLDLPTLIRVKEIANRPKDRTVLPILRATLAEQQKGKP